MKEMREKCSHHSSLLFRTEKLQVRISIGNGELGIDVIFRVGYYDRVESASFGHLNEETERKKIEQSGYRSHENTGNYQLQVLNLE